MLPRVLVGCPTSDYKSYCIEQYANSVKNLSYKNYDILIIDNSKDDDYFTKIRRFGLPVIKSTYHEKARARIIESRNLIRQIVLDKGYDYFLSLEQDVIPPRDIIERLVRHKKDIVSGVYFAYNNVKGKNILRPLLWANFDPEKKLMYCLKSEYALKSNDFVEICACGLGCVLIHRSVLEVIKFRYKPGMDGFDDVFFCKDAIDNGIKMFADLSVKCNHLTQGWSWEKIEK